MLLLNVRTYLTLLWGASALFPMESMSSSISTPPPSPPTQATTPPPTSTLKPVELSVSAITKTTATPTMETEEVDVTFSSDSSNDTMASWVSTNTAASNASSSGPQLFHTSAAAAASPAASEAQPSHSTVRPTQDTLHQQSPTASTPAATSSAATSSAATEAASSPQPPTTAAESASTSRLSFSTSSAGSTHTPVFTQKLSTPSTFSASAATMKSTAQSTSSPASTNERSTRNTESTSVFQTVSVTQVHTSTAQFTDAEESRSTEEPTTISLSTNATDATTNTTGNATSPAGIYIPIKPKRLPIPTKQSTPLTTKTPSEASKSPPAAEDQTCSSRGVVKQCLIIIASLAALATIFMVSTIVLCTKLSARKHRDKKPQRDTEMMCISALLPERSYTYTRQRNPVSNGVLVMHMAGDSDEDGGDNLTLSSFLPENERYV